MSTLTHPDLPPHTRAMHLLHKSVANAFTAHWKAHQKPPQKLILTPQQADDLLATQLYGRAAGFKGAPDRERFFDRPVEIVENTVGEMVAIDGAVTPISDYAPPPPASK